MTYDMKKYVSENEFFTWDELRCNGSGVVKLAPGFAEMIDNIRKGWGPLTVNSCCRSMQYNAKVGGAKSSYHIYDHPARSYGTCAIDFSMPAFRRREFVKYLLDNFPDASIGVAKTFIHVDFRTVYDGKPATLFTY